MAPFEIVPALYYLLWVCVPILPATVIYALFPKNPIGVHGPLGNLTISATGAFAAYVIVFVLAYPIINKQLDVVGGMSRPIWGVEAKVKLIEQDGTPADQAWLGGLQVNVRPDVYTTANQFVTVYIHQEGNKFPKIILSIPKFGSEVVDISDDSNIKSVDISKKLVILKDIEIHRMQVIQRGIGAEPSALSKANNDFPLQK